ncbi:MAG: hypothetical protein QOJ98_957 [Acidobacteriota bacterium]|nr:hypothetical protein [Acidobacteriota bacterium]
MSRFARIGLIVLIGALFFAWHSPLLSPEGRVRGFNSDAAIIALMGKKMLEGRGFDVFFWGQNYVGPLTSIFIAGAGAMTGGVDPLALRLGTFLEVLAGILLTGLAVSRLDRRAAVAAMVALAITPPVILRMMVTPLGAEMAFVFASALLALFFWYPRPLALGLLAGFSWWMNQQVVFTLIAGALVLAFRSPAMRRELLLLRERWAFRTTPMPGVVQAFAWLSTRIGLLLLILFVAFDLLSIDVMPFIFGRATDALLLLLVPFALPLVFGEWRRFSLPPLAPLARFALGFAIGYAPVWLGALLGWYERTYVFAFRMNYPSGVLEQLRSFPRVAAHWTGAAPGLLGILYAIALCIFLGAALWKARASEGRVLLALIPLGNLAFYLLAEGAKPHYLIASVGMLFALAALGAVDLWPHSRPLVAAGAVIAILSLATSARTMHHDVLREPDPRPLLARVEAAGCQVCYTDFWLAYRYRLLDEERRAWIPYLSQNRTRAESRAMQQLPGQRCLVGPDGVVQPIPHDLPLTHEPPRSGTSTGAAPPPNRQRRGPG